MQKFQPGQWGRHSTKPTEKVDEQAAAAPQLQLCSPQTRLQLRDCRQQSQLSPSSARAADKHHLTPYPLFSSCFAISQLKSRGKQNLWLQTSLHFKVLASSASTSSKIYFFLQCCYLLFGQNAASALCCTEAHRAAFSYISYSFELKTADCAVATTFPPWRIHDSNSLSPTLWYNY